ncbi:HPP family protein [Pulveribacter sp.]|uniref:HPP family protein n=1 Tax=Pulveribacter sp. TaxID=2678893 RepID=UPI0028975D17|nr:HPP family protein [Pulveribacter sp.]
MPTSRFSAAAAPMGAAGPAARRLLEWLRRFFPQPVGLNWRERLRMVLGTGLCIAVVAVLAHELVTTLPTPWLVASIGASAVLVIAVPASPLAQPWAVLAGTALSFLIGIGCATWVTNVVAACALAVGLSVAAMLALRCLHPPGGAMALFAVLHPPEATVPATGPLLLNVAVLVLTALVYNNLTGRSYPHQAQKKTGLEGAAASPFIAADLDAALAHYDEVLDVSRADLEGLLHLVGRAAFQRTLGDLRCRDIMSAPVHAVVPQASLTDAWALMRREAVKALPVVDSHGVVLGIITVADFMRLANLDTHEGMGQRLRKLVLGRPRQPDKVEGLMSSPAQQVHAGQPVMDLVPLFSEAGHHHFPVVDEGGQLAGIITQTDLVRALARAVAYS